MHVVVLIKYGSFGIIVCILIFSRLMLSRSMCFLRLPYVFGVK